MILASQSPRRRELLKQLIEGFDILVPNIDEDALTVMSPYETAQKLAVLKGLRVQESRPEALIISGDTVVALPKGNGEYLQLSKPQNEEDAVRMLLALSGKTHSVISGVGLFWPGGSCSDFDETKVSFRAITFEEAKEYVATGEPMDKAGSYAIQGGAAKFVTSIEGSLSNVVGLPIELLENMLTEASKSWTLR